MLVLFSIDADCLLDERAIIETMFSFRAVFYLAVFKSEERVISARTDIFAGENSRASLAHQHRTDRRAFSLLHFNPKVFRV